MGQNHMMTWLYLSIGAAATLVMYHKNFLSLLVLPTEEWQQDNRHCSVVTGDEGRLGGLDVCLCLHRETKMLITLLAKLKAYFKPA